MRRGDKFDRIEVKERAMTALGLANIISGAISCLLFLLFWTWGACTGFVLFWGVLVSIAAMANGVLFGLAHEALKITFSRE
jgi:uncharacterized membrane protein